MNEYKQLLFLKRGNQNLSIEIRSTDTSVGSCRAGMKNVNGAAVPGNFIDAAAGEREQGRCDRHPAVDGCLSCAECIGSCDHDAVGGSCAHAHEVLRIAVRCGTYRAVPFSGKAVAVVLLRYFESVFESGTVDGACSVRAGRKTNESHGEWICG